MRDIKICGASARFGAAVGLLGFPVAPPELQYLLRFAGSATTAEFLLEGRILTADKASHRQLVSDVAADEDIARTLQAVEERVCQGSPLVARVIKQRMRSLSAQDARFSRQERRTFYRFANTDDYLAGRQAFLSKRAPVVTGT